MRFKPVHHRPLHLREVERNPGVLEPPVDRLEALARRVVDGVHPGTLEDEVPDGGVGGDGLVHEILDEARVRKVEAGIDPERHDLGIGDHLVAFDVAEMLGSRDLAQHRDVRA